MNSLRRDAYFAVLCARLALSTALMTALTMPAYAQVRGDFNNDGFGDLAIGIPVENKSGVNAGAVHVIYGSASGLQVGTSGPEDQFWRQSSSGVKDDSERDDHFGSALAVGDFNRDGFDDLAIGVPDEDIGGIQDAGAVNVLYGSPSGLQAGGSGLEDQLWHQDVPGVEEVAEVADHFGFSLTAGDFNRDGFDDLAIGVPDEGLQLGSAIVRGGAVNVLYGSATGLQASGSGGPNDQFWHQGTEADAVRDVAEFRDGFGSALASGDFNRDGFDDLAIAVPHENLEGPNFFAGAGAINVLYGSVVGLQAGGFNEPDDQFWHQDSIDVGGNDVKDNVEDHDRFGSALATGDFDNDGFADLAIGVPEEKLIVSDREILAGAVHVLFGSRAGLQAGGLGREDEFWHQGPNPGGFVPDEPEGHDYFGFALAAGDFDGDGFDELAIGVPGEQSPTIQDGAVNVLFGSPGGLLAPGQFWTQTIADVLPETFLVGNFFGWSVTVGDFNDDGFVDLAIGDPGENLLEGRSDVIYGAGAVNVLYGSAAGLQTTGVGGPDDQLWHQNVRGVRNSAEDCDFYGLALAARAPGTSRGGRFRDIDFFDPVAVPAASRCR